MKAFASTVCVCSYLKCWISKLARIQSSTMVLTSEFKQLLPIDWKKESEFKTS